MIRYTATMYCAQVCPVPFSKLSICNSFSPFIIDNVYALCDHLYIFCFIKAYIPLQRETNRVGPLCWFRLETSMHVSFKI